MNDAKKTHVVIVGGGFAGLGCARKLAAHDHVHVTLIDKNDYHQFQPLLYQLATSALSPSDIASPLRKFFEGMANVDVKMAEIVSIDPHTRTVKSREGETYQGDYVVLAAGSQANFFGTAGADQYAFPLYTLIDGERLRSRILAVLEDADRNPKLIEKGALNFVIVGAGPTGTETAGAIADMINEALPKEFPDLNTKAARIYLVDYGHVVLGPFSEKAQKYAAKTLQERGVQLKTWRRGERSRPGPRPIIGWNKNPDAHGHLGRRIESLRIMRNMQPASRAGRTAGRGIRPDFERVSQDLCVGRFRQYSEP